MQSSKAMDLKKAWGEKPCEHPEFSKEYYLGAHTGDYICKQCGESFSPDELSKLELKQHTQKEQ